VFVCHIQRNLDIQRINTKICGAHDRNGPKTNRLNFGYIWIKNWMRNWQSSEWPLVAIVLIYESIEKNNGNLALL
jgi:hypothetical protein